MKPYVKKNTSCRGTKGQAIDIQRTMRSPFWPVHNAYVEGKW